METNNQDQIKDLQYFKQTYAEEKGFKSWNGFISNLPDVAMDAHWLVGDHLTKVAELYAAHRVQQAKDAAFKERGGKYQELVQKLADWSRKYPRGRIYSFHKAHMDDELIALEDEAKTLCPYTTGEKAAFVTWKEAIKDFLSFSRVTFSEATAISSMSKLEEECDEVCDVIAGKDGELAEEYADCLMCIFDSAMRAGISQEEILSAFIDKTATNKSRKWIKSPDNTYSGEKGGEDNG